MNLDAELAPVLIWMSDPDKRCTYVNTTWRRFTGRSLEAVLADGWRESIHGDDLPRCLQVLDVAFGERRPFTQEHRLRRHDGEYRWVLDSGVPLLAPDGSLTGYVGSSVDVTERRLAEDSLRRKESELREAQRLAAIGSWQWGEHGRSRLVRRAIPRSGIRARLARGRRQESPAPVPARRLATD